MNYEAMRGVYSLKFIMNKHIINKKILLFLITIIAFVIFLFFNFNYYKNSYLSDKIMDCNKVEEIIESRIEYDEIINLYYHDNLIPYNKDDNYYLIH